METDNNQKTLKLFTPGVEKILHFFAGEIESVVEIGSADGIDADYLAKAYKVDPRKVHIIEPRPEAVCTIKLDYPYYNVYDLALSNYDGEAVPFNIRPAGMEEGSSLLLRHNEPDFYVNSINVKVRKFETFIQENSISSFDLIKVDVEGCAYEVIQGFGELINNVKIFHIEVENVVCWENQRLRTDVLSLFPSNFELVYSPGEYQEDLILINRNLVNS